MLGLGELIAAATDPGRDVVVVIDDAHELTDRTIWRAFNHLIAMTPPWLHWIVMSRADPPLGSRKLQLHGRLTRFRSDDLAFDTDETARLLAELGRALPEPAVRQLCQWSEGWAAALCLAAIALPHDGNERPWEHLASTEHLVLDFLVEEVLERLAPADRRFLLRLSAADLITPDLAACLTGSKQAAARLHRLERAGTFLLEADPRGAVVPLPQLDGDPAARPPPGRGPRRDGSAHTRRGVVVHGARAGRPR